MASPKKDLLYPTTTCLPLTGVLVRVSSPHAGDEALISMSGIIGPRFSFTHYPQGGESNGPGVTLVRPIPDPSAPCVTFLGMSPRMSGGSGLAIGRLGPVLGEVGTSTARVLVEVIALEVFCRELG